MGYTLNSARSFLSMVDIRIQKRDTEFRITDMRLDNNRHKQEAGAYYTDCIDDAVLTGLAMARARR